MSPARTSHGGVPDLSSLLLTRLMEAHMPRKITPLLTEALAQYLSIRSSHCAATTMANDKALLTKFVARLPRLPWNPRPGVDFRGLRKTRLLVFSACTI